MIRTKVSSTRSQAELVNVSVLLLSGLPLAFSPSFWLFCHRYICAHTSASSFLCFLSSPVIFKQDIRVQ